MTRHPLWGSPGCCCIPPRLGVPRVCVCPTWGSLGCPPLWGSPKPPCPAHSGDPQRGPPIIKVSRPSPCCPYVYQSAPPPPKPSATAGVTSPIAFIAHWGWGRCSIGQRGGAGTHDDCGQRHAMASSVTVQCPCPLCTTAEGLQRCNAASQRCCGSSNMRNVPCNVLVAPQLITCSDVMLHPGVAAAP